MRLIEYPRALQSPPWTGRAGASGGWGNYVSLIHFDGLVQNPVDFGHDGHEVLQTHPACRCSDPFCQNSRASRSNAELAHGDIWQNGLKEPLDLGCVGQNSVLLWSLTNTASTPSFIKASRENSSLAWMIFSKLEPAPCRKSFASSRVHESIYEFLLGFDGHLAATRHRPPLPVP